MSINTNADAIKAAYQCLDESSLSNETFSLSLLQAISILLDSGLEGSTIKLVLNDHPNLRRVGVSREELSLQIKRSQIIKKDYDKKIIYFLKGKENGKRNKRSN